MKDYMRKYRTTHTQLTASIPTEIADQLRRKLKEDKMSYTKFIMTAIQDYLNKKGD